MICEQSRHLTADPGVPGRCSLKPLSRSFDHQCKLAFIWPSPLISACCPFFSPSAHRDLLFSLPPPFDLRRAALVFMYAAKKGGSVEGHREETELRCSFSCLFKRASTSWPACHRPPLHLSHTAFIVLRQHEPLKGLWCHCSQDPECTFKTELVPLGCSGRRLSVFQGRTPLLRL